MGRVREPWFNRVPDGSGRGADAPACPVSSTTHLHRGPPQGEDRQTIEFTAFGVVQDINAVIEICCAVSSWDEHLTKSIEGYPYTLTHGTRNN